MDVIDEALAVAGERKPLTKEQRDRIRYWDYYLYWVDQSLDQQKRRKEKEHAAS